MSKYLEEFEVAKNLYKVYIIFIQIFNVIENLY